MKSKFLLSLIGLISASNAFAVVIHERPSPQYRFQRAEYRINSELGRAWIELRYNHDELIGIHPDGRFNAWNPVYYRVRVEGMRFDAQSRQILIENEVCATVTFRDGVFSDYWLIQPTGNCVFRAQVVTKDVDDGFIVQRREVVQVTLETRGAHDAAAVNSGNRIQ